MARPRRATTTTTSSARLRDGGLRDRRHDDAARVRDPAGHRGARLRPDAQPVGPRAHARRLLRRRRGGGRGRHGAGRARQRRRRLDPHPGRLLRARRAKPQRGRISLAPELGDSLARDRRRADAHRRRHRGAARRARRLRARRRDVGAAAGRAVRRSAPRASRASLRIAFDDATRRCPTPRSTRSAAQRRRATPPSCCARSATRSRRSTRRGRTQALLPLFGAVFLTAIALSIAYSGDGRRARPAARGHGAR